MSHLPDDLRYAWRIMRRSPGFAAAAVSTLALGMGATAAIFSVVDGVLLRSLPYTDAHRIVSITVSRAGETDSAFAPANYLDLERGARSFEAMAAYREAAFDLATGGRDPERLEGAFTTRQFFEVFRVQPLAGRVYGSADGPGGPRLAVLSEGAWRRVFGSDPRTVGSTVRLSGRPYTIAGIAPSTLRWPDAQEVWVLADRPVPPPPLEVEGDYLNQRGLSYFNVIARIRAGVPFPEAEQDVVTIAARLAHDHPDNNRTRSMGLVALHDLMIGDVRPALLALLAAVGLVMLIAAGNVAHLLLARGAARAREFAVRGAIGAGVWRLVRQLLVEGLLLAAVGGVLGLLIGQWFLRGLVALAPADIPRLYDVQLDWHVVAVTAGIVLASAILFALAPALQAARIDVVEALKGGGRTATAGAYFLRRALVIGEVALASMLLVGAGLLLHSFWRLLDVDPGFSRQRVVALELALPESRYDTSQVQARFYRAFIDRLATIRDRQTVAAGFPRPFGDGTDSSAPFQIEGRPETLRSDRPIALLAIATPGYFRTLGIPLVRGRDFNDDDREGHEPVVIVNEVMARRYWPDVNALGQRIDLGGNKTWWRIVGIAGSHRSKSLAAAPEATVFLPYQQFTLPFLTVYTRTQAGAPEVAGQAKAVLRDLDPDLPLGGVHEISDVMDEALALPRFRTSLIAVFAGLALLLAAIGVYGVLTYSVTQRLREFGIRLTLGATPMHVVRLTLREGLSMTGIGLAIGLIGSWVAARFLGSLLFEVSTIDPLTFIAVPLLLGLVAVAACLRPSIRAASVDPATSLRMD
jgi:putative ABC transport system permease protein